MKAFSKGLYRTITGNARRYILLILILVLGCASFVGLNSTGPDMRLSMDKYYDDYKLYDLQILSETGFSEQTLDNIAGISGVQDVIPSHMADVLVNIGKGSFLVRFENKTADAEVNRAWLNDGKLPETRAECAVEARFMKKNNLKLGDTIKVSGNMAALLASESFEIVGSVSSPQYNSEELGGGLQSFAYVADSAFIDLGVYICAYVKVGGAEGLSRFSDGYYDLCKRAGDAVRGVPGLEGAYVLDLSSNPSHVGYKKDSERIEAISKVFPLIFFIVAIMMAFTIIVRLIEADRGEIGTLRSLGYGSFKVYQKYIMFSLFAGIPSAAIGMLMGFWLFPSVIYNGGYKMLYALPRLLTPINWFYSGLAALMAVSSVLLPTILLCLTQFKAKPAELMRPSAPPPGKRILLERIPFVWKRMSFFSKVTSRNIMRNRKKSLMTIIGVLGCTALILTGFGLNNSINDIVDKHFDELYLCDLRVNIIDGAENGIEEAGQALKDDPAVLGPAHYFDGSVVVKAGGDEMEGGIVVPEDEAEFGKYIKFRETSGRRFFGFYSDGIVITQKMAYTLGIRAGDTVTLAHKGQNVQVKVSNVTENYIYHFVYLPKSLYEDLFKEPLRSNTIVCGLSDLSDDAEKRISALLTGCPPVGSYTFSINVKEYYGDLIDSLGVIVMVLIICGALLAFVVLFSLTAMNVDERKRELATLKVLGFYNRETSNYIFIENTVLTVIGIALGLVVGIFLHKFVGSTAEIDMIMFGKHIHPLSYVYSAVMTFCFMVAVNLIMNPAVRKINMIESLKAVE